MSHPYPWYSNDSYGGITLPHGNTYETIYTNNLFDDDDLGKNIYDWLAIASHEVGHINASNKTADASYQNQIKASKLAHGRFSPQPKAQLRLQTYMIDLDGRKWDESSVTQKNGNVTINLTLTVAILNSSNKKFDLKKLGNVLSSQLQSSYGISYVEGMNYETENTY